MPGQIADTDTTIQLHYALLHNVENLVLVIFSVFIPYSNGVLPLYIFIRFFKLDYTTSINIKLAFEQQTCVDNAVKTVCVIVNSCWKIISCLFLKFATELKTIFSILIFFCVYFYSILKKNQNKCFLDLWTGIYLKMNKKSTHNRKSCPAFRDCLLFFILGLTAIWVGHVNGCSKTVVEVYNTNLSRYLERFLYPS